MPPEPARAAGANDILAFDFDPESVRDYDTFGRLHVKETPISKAAVNDYFGHEIPNAEKLGLDPDRKYAMLRDPEELKKAARTANNLPIMARHIAQSPDDPHQDKVVGSTGTDAVFDAPHLKNSMAFWTRDGIDGVESGKKRQLSASYSYDPDMTPGIHEGKRYDGVMRNIKFNHIAIVPEGRAGPDVLVEDAMPPGMRNPQENNMPASKKALLVRGALTAYLKPKLAMDAKIDLKSVLLGTTAANWTTAKPTIAQRMREATTGRLAKDANLDDMHGFLDSLDREGEGEPDTMDAEPESEEDKRKREEKAAADKAARDEEAETEEERKARMERRKEAKDKAARDKAARDAETPETKAKREEDERKAEDGRRARDAEPKPVTKAAMDSAISDAVSATERRMRDAQTALREAEEIVRPVIGVVLAQDSAEAVYRLLFAAEDIDVGAVPAEAFKPLAVQTVRAAQRAKSVTPRLAHDAAVKGFAQAHPEVARIRIF